MDVIAEGPALERAREGLCPGCGKPRMRGGPVGGCSRNWRCTACGRRWNLSYIQPLKKGDLSTLERFGRWRYDIDTMFSAHNIAFLQEITDA